MAYRQMTSQGQTACEMRWVSVQDENGRERLEAHWIDPSAMPVAAVAPDAAPIAIAPAA